MRTKGTLNQTTAFIQGVQCSYFIHENFTIQMRSSASSGFLRPPSIFVFLSLSSFSPVRSPFRSLFSLFFFNFCFEVNFGFVFLKFVASSIDRKKNCKWFEIQTALKDNGPMSRTTLCLPMRSERIAYV